MPAQTFLPGPTPSTVRTPSGQTIAIPAGWELLPPGDPALTRRVKAAGEFWLVQEKVGRRMFSRGIWAPRQAIERIRKGLVVERTTAYDSMKIARAKGQRREVRRMLAQRSKELLGGYRRGEPIAPACPLARALKTAQARSTS